MIKKLASKLSYYLLEPLFKKLKYNIFRPSTVVEQKTLCASYRHQYISNLAPLSFNDVGFRLYSQHEEDGILLYIFSLIGTTNKKSVEICAGNGIECNTANLIINHRWIGLLCDGKEENIKEAKQFYATNSDTKYWPPTIKKEWITKGNVNTVIEQNNFNGEIDLLSLDIDGIDYWLWKEISIISPRVVVLEFNHLWGPEKSVTVPYKDDFIVDFTEYGSDYAGASLKAFVKLGRAKGYRLVGTNTIATNAFFVRNDIECSWLPEVETSTCFDHPRAQFGMEKRLLGVKDKEWEEV